MEEEALWLPESDPHDLAAKRRDAETPKQRVTTILATLMPSAGVRRPRTRFGGNATVVPASDTFQRFAAIGLSRIDLTVTTRLSFPGVLEALSCT